MHYIFGIFRPFQINHVCENFHPHGMPETREVPCKMHILFATRSCFKPLSNCTESSRFPLLTLCVSCDQRAKAEQRKEGPNPPTPRRTLQVRWGVKALHHRSSDRAIVLGNVSETPTPSTCLKSTAVHLQFVRQYAPHLYRRTFLASKLRRKGNPAVRLPFVLQYASHLYAVRPPFVRQYFWKNTGGWGHRNVSEILRDPRSAKSASLKGLLCDGIMSGVFLGLLPDKITSHDRPCCSNKFLASAWVLILASA